MGDSKVQRDVGPDRLQCQTQKVQKLVCSFEKGTVLRKPWCSKQCDSGQKSFIEEKIIFSLKVDALITYLGFYLTPLCPSILFSNILISFCFSSLALLSKSFESIFDV